MTARWIERYLARDLAFKMADWDLRNARLSYRNAQIDPSRSVFWLEQTRRYSDRAAQRMADIA